MEAPADIQFDDWTLRRRPRELLRDGVRVRLQDMPLQVLEELLTAPGELVTREHLISQLWPKRIVEYDAALNAAVRRLRAALGDEAETPRYIETVPRQGYRFVGSIRTPPKTAEPIPSPSDVVSRPTTAAEAPAASAFEAPASAGMPAPESRRRWPLLAALVVAAGVLVAWVLFRSGSGPSAHLIAMGEVEVQPFTANPPDPQRDARAASYAGAFRQRFTELGIRNSVPGENRTAQEPELILAGELNDVGGKNVLTSRIYDRQSGATLWTARREPTEGAASESNLAAFALKCALKRRDPALGTDALSRYIYGCAHFLERDFAALHAVAKQLYDAAPNNPEVIAFFGFANAGAGWAEARSSAQGKRFLEEATRLSQAALKLDPNNADALFTMGFSVNDYQFAEQETWWRRAIEADPEAGWALGRYARFLTDVGRVREAIDLGLRAQLHRRVTDSPVAHALASIGELGSAHAQYALVRAMDPQWVDREEMLTEVFYGDADATEQKLIDRPELAGDQQECWWQILAARRKQPLDAAQFAKACGGQGDFSARAFAIFGDLDAAYRELEVYFVPEPRYIPQLFWPEMHDFIRDRRFWPLMARLGLAGYWLQTNQWPDFCSEPKLPFDCRMEARKVAVKANR